MEHPSKKHLDEAIARAKEKVDQQVKEHKDEDLDLKEAVGGTVSGTAGLYRITTYET